MDEQVRQTKQQNLLHLERQAATYGLDVPLKLANEIAALRAELGIVPTEYLALPTMAAPAPSYTSVSRYEFDALSERVQLVTWALMLSSISCILGLASFVMALVVLVSR